MSSIKSFFGQVADYSGSGYSISPDLIYFAYSSESFRDIQTSGSLATFRTITKVSSSEGASGAFRIIVSDPTSLTTRGAEAIRFEVSSSLPRVGIGFPLSYTPSNEFEVLGTIAASGSISASGDITASAFSGDGSGLTGIVTTTGTPADNQVAVFTDSDTVEGSSKLLFDGSILDVVSTNNASQTVRIYGGVFGAVNPYISPIGSTTLKFGDGTSGDIFDFQNNKIAFDSDATNTYIMADTSTPENLEIHADGNIELRADSNLEIHSPISTDITASGNISASDTAHAKFLRIPQGTGGGEASIYFGSGPADNNGVIYDDGSDLIIGYNDTDVLSINNTRARVAGGFEVIGAQGSITASNDISASGIITSLSASIDHVLVNNKLQGNGSGFQFFAFNEDTTKVKFANWYSSNQHQYGMGMLWYETWFGAMEDTNQGNDLNRRIGFYLESPEAGASDSTSGVANRHPNNARFFVDITGSYVNSGSLTVTDANFKVSSSGDVTAQGIISSSDDIIGNRFVISADKRFAEASGDQLRINEAAHFTDGVQINRGSLPQPFTVNGTTVTLNGGITASSTISASGDLFASTIKSQDYFVVSRSSAFTDNEFLVADGAGGVESTDALAVSASNLGIGVAKPEVRLHMLGEAAQTTQILMEQFNDTQDAPDIRTRRYRGTSASRADVQAGDYLFRFNVHGQDGGSSELYGSMQFDVDDSDQDAMVWNLQTRDTTGTVADRLTIDKDGDVTIAGDLAISGIANVSESIASIPSSYRVLLQSNFFHGQTTKRYMPFNNTGEQTGFNYISITPAAADGRLISVTVWPQSNGGSTIIGLHLNSNATAATTDTQTLSIGAPTTFTFSSNNTFSQNDELSISFDPTNTPNGISAQIILEYDY